MLLKNSNGQEIPFTSFYVPQNGLLQRTTTPCVTDIWLKDDTLFTCDKTRLRHPNFHSLSHLWLVELSLSDDRFGQHAHNLTWSNISEGFLLLPDLWTLAHQGAWNLEQPLLKDFWESADFSGVYSSLYKKVPFLTEMLAYIIVKEFSLLQ